MEIKIKIADANIGFEDDILRTLGLGSCIAIMLYDRAKKVGGLIHYMLPKQIAKRDVLNEFKYAETGVPKLIAKMEVVGAKTYRMEAKIAGGANMFAEFIRNNKESVGYRNIQAAKRILHEFKIPVLAASVGEDYSRSVEFILKTGVVKITSFKKGEELL